MSQKIDLFNHIGGIKTALSPFFYKPNETPLALNIGSHQELGAVTKAEQYDAFGGSSGSSYLQAIQPAEYPNGDSLLFSVNAGLVYKYTPGGWVNLAVGFTAMDATVMWGSAFMYDTVYFTDGLKMYYSANEGAFWTAHTLSPVPKLLEVFKNRLYGANFSGNTNRFRFSDVSDGTTFSTANYVDTIDAPIVAMKATLNYLYLFTAESTWRWDETYLYKVDDIGVRSAYAAVYGAQMMFFIGTDGIFQVNGGRAPYQISRPVQDWLDGVEPTNIPKFNTGFFKDEVYFWIGDSLGYTDVVLVYNTVFKSWRVLTGWPSAMMAVWTDSTIDKRLYFAKHTTNGVYRYGGTVNQDDVAVTAQYDYPILTPAGGDKEFQGKSLHCFARSTGLATFQIQYALNWQDDFVALKEWELRGEGFTETIQINVPASVCGKAVQWRILESTSGIPWTWEGMRFYFDTTRGVND